MQIYLAVTPAEAQEASRFRCSLAHVAYCIGPDSTLLRQNLLLQTRGGLLSVTDRGAPFIASPERLSAAALRECGRRSYGGVLLDFEQPPAPDRLAFAETLARRLSPRPVYVPESYAAASGAIPLICTAISGGNFVQRLQEAAAGRDRAYADGDILYLGGEAYRLRVLLGTKESVEPIGRVLVVTQKEPADKDRRKRMVEKYLTKRCRERIETLCRSLYPEFEKLGVAWPKIRIRSMVSRWGSCQPVRGVLTFARQLVEVPEGCAEYVVAHEFAHFIHPDHSPRFHEFMTRLMPDWKQRKQLLNSRAWVTPEK